MGDVLGARRCSDWFRGPCALCAFGVASGLECLRASSRVSVSPPTCSFVLAVPLSSQAPGPEAKDSPWSQSPRTGPSLLSVFDQDCFWLGVSLAPELLQEVPSASSGL